MEPPVGTNGTVKKEKQLNYKTKNFYLCQHVHTHVLMQKYATENILNRLYAYNNNFSFGCVTCHTTTLCTI